MFSTNRIHSHKPLQPTVREAALLRTFFPRPGQMAKPLSALLGIALACGCASILAIAGESRCLIGAGLSLKATDPCLSGRAYNVPEEQVNSFGNRFLVPAAVFRLVAGESPGDRMEHVRRCLALQLLPTPHDQPCSCSNR